MQPLVQRKPFPVFAFNHDGCGLLIALCKTAMSEQDAMETLVRPLVETGMNVIDFSILTTAVHNIRTRHRRVPVHLPGVTPECYAELGRVIRHYNQQPLDLLDIVVKHGHRFGMQVFGALRLNHDVPGNPLREVPGPTFSNRVRKDFRSPVFHDYLCELIADIAAHGVDGITLDFERKAPFFPVEATQRERFAGTRAFLQRVRDTTDLPLAARVSYDPATGVPNGQDPLAWIRDGLVDILIPATHNHEPDLMDWSIERFVEAAAGTSCQVWPQIWPVRSPWQARNPATVQPVDALQNRVERLLADGADGVYYFNFCCFLGNPAASSLILDHYTETFCNLHGRL